MSLTCGHKKGNCDVCWTIDESNRVCLICCKLHNPTGNKQKKHVNEQVPMERPSKRNCAEVAAAAFKDQIQTDELVEMEMDAADELWANHNVKIVALFEENSTLVDLSTAFGFDLNDLQRRLPSKHSTLEAMADFTVNHWSTLTNALKKITDCAARILLPVSPSTLITRLVDWFRIDKSAKEAEKLDDLVKDLFAIRKSSTKGSTQRRVFSSILVRILGRNELNNRREKYDATFSFESAKNGMDDWQSLLEGETLKQNIRRCKNFNSDELDATIAWILSEKNIVPLSWGERPVRLDRYETVRLPRITRRLTPKLMYENYDVYLRTKYPSDVDRYKNGFSETTFHRIISAITFGNDRILSAVDYVTGVLINDPIRILDRVIEDFTDASSVERKNLKSKVNLTKNFLKVQYNDHINKENDNCDTHSIEYALRKVNDSTKPSIPRNLTCNACKFPHVVQKLLTEMVDSNLTISQEMKKDATTVIQDSFKKFQLYERHIARVQNQQKAITLLHEEMKARCKANKSSDECIVVDWKMKCEPMYHRETTQKHFGKRGVSWNGDCIHFYEYDAVKMNAIRKTIYLDQIMEQDNEQDGMAVAALLELFLSQIQKELPFIKKITLQSDNAGCFQCKFLLVTIPLINSLYNCKIVRYLHTETQDGKGKFKC